MMQKLKLWMPYLFGMLGPAGISGLVLLVATAGLSVFLIKPQHDANRQLGAQLEGQLRKAMAAPVAVRQVDALKELGPESKVPEAVAYLFQAADDTGLLLDKGDYHLVSDKVSPFRQYQITLPLSGRYPALRDFINEALQQPGLVLDSLKLSRDSVEAEEMEAQLQLTLFVRVSP